MEGAEEGEGAEGEVGLEEDGGKEERDSGDDPGIGRVGVEDKNLL